MVSVKRIMPFALVLLISCKPEPQKSVEPGPFGEAPLLTDGRALYVTAQSGGKQLRFLIDTASGASYIDKAAVPLGATRTSSANKGDLSTIGGKMKAPENDVRLAEMTLGTIHLKDVTLREFEHLPQVGTQPADGVIGNDILAVGKRVQIFPGLRDRNPRIVFSQTPLTQTVIRVPCSIHGVVFIKARLNGVMLDCMFDTGNFYTMMPPETATRCRVKPGPPGPVVAGADGKPLRTREAPLTNLEFGGAEINILAAVGPTPVFQNLGINNHALLLGCAFVFGYTAVEIDYEGNTVAIAQ